MSRPRNVIMIQSDQHRSGWMGCAGAQHVETPALDALAARGVRFAHAYCTYPLCGPSRMSFLTGLHPSRLGMHTNEESLASHHPTFVHALGLGGYHTVLCGRMHFCGIDQRHGFAARIFGDYNASYPGGPRPVIGEEWRRGSSNGRIAVEHARTAESSYFLDYDEEVTKAAESYIADHAAQDAPGPLALCVGYFMPHTPFSAPEHYVARVRALAGHMPAVWPVRQDLNHWERSYILQQRMDDLAPDDFSETRVQYAAMIMYLDDRIARVLKAAESLPGETLVLYWSDHGEAAGDNGVIAKGCLAETSLRVPLIVAPLRRGECGMEDPGRVWNHPVSLVDLAPTLTACTGSPDIPCVDGHSLLPILHGKADPGQWEQRPVFSEVEILSHLPPARMVRRGRYKYVYYHDDRDTLFDIEADPTERHNLLGGITPGDQPEAEHAALAEELKRLALDEWDPEQLQRDCRRNWQRRGMMMNWGQTVGSRLLGRMESWPGFTEPTGS